MELLVKDGVTHSLQRGDTVVVTLALQPSTQQRLLFQRQLRALFPQQKVVVLDPGMTFTVYRETGTVQTTPAVAPAPTASADDDALKPPARRKQ